MEIRFKQPIDFHLKVIETCDHVLSMCVQAKIVITLFQHVCQYEGEFWIACASWDEFTNSLRDSLWQETVLRDMSGYFLLTLRRTDDGLLFVWELRKTGIYSNQKVHVAFSSIIDDGVLGKISSEFFDFPAWW